VRITHINAYDVAGGAARAAYRLHQGLRQLGHDSRLLVQQKDSADPNVTQFNPRRDLPSRVRRRIQKQFLSISRKPFARLSPGASYFSDDRSEYRAELLSQVPPGDILHLHWLAGFLDYGSFFSGRPKDLPVVWTLHDMNPFTGGCHFDAGCGKFSELCGACPQLGSADTDDFSARSRRRKQKAFEGLDKTATHIVAPSRWIADEAKKSSLLGEFAVSVIPYGVNTEIYQPGGRKAARDQFGVPADAKVILFVADWANEKRKGLAVLFDAIRKIEAIPELCVVTIGRAMLEQDVGRPRISLDYVSDENTMSKVYNTADVFVIPSLQDNFPNTALEALACGVPVVGFGVGGLREIVREGKTGKLAVAGDARALSDAIAALLHDSARLGVMAEESRRVALQEYRLEIQARRYAELYQNLVEKRASIRI